MIFLWIRFFINVTQRMSRSHADTRSQVTHQLAWQKASPKPLASHLLWKPVSVRHCFNICNIDRQGIGKLHLPPFFIALLDVLSSIIFDFIRLLISVCPRLCSKWVHSFPTEPHQVEPACSLMWKGRTCNHEILKKGTQNHSDHPVKLCEFQPSISRAYPNISQTTSSWKPIPLIFCVHICWAKRRNVAGQTTGLQPNCNTHISLVLWKQMIQSIQVYTSQIEPLSSSLGESRWDTECQ